MQAEEVTHVATQAGIRGEFAVWWKSGKKTPHSGRTGGANSTTRWKNGKKTGEESTSDAAPADDGDTASRTAIPTAAATTAARTVALLMTKAREQAQGQG